MVSWIILVIALVVSLVIVIKAADIFVDNLVDIGKSVGISEIILGVTASAIGTSLPEFGSAMISVLSGSPDLGVGVVLGSNIWNIAGILGISAFVAGGIATGARELKRDGLMTLITGLILLGFIMFVSSITAVVGIILVIAYAIYMWVLIKDEKEHKNESSDEPEESTSTEAVSTENQKPVNKKRSLLMVVIGLIGLVVGCEVMVWSGVGIAEVAHVPQMIIGLFALAIGTSMPELVVTLGSALKKLHSLSMGTILGSNIFNILIGIGVPSLFTAIPVERLSVTFDAPVMIFVTALLILLSIRNKKLSRWGGLILIITYLVYAVLRLFVLA